MMMGLIILAVLIALVMLALQGAFDHMDEEN